MYVMLYFGQLCIETYFGARLAIGGGGCWKICVYVDNKSGVLRFGNQGSRVVWTVKVDVQITIDSGANGRRVPFAKELEEKCHRVC